MTFLGCDSAEPAFSEFDSEYSEFDTEFSGDTLAFAEVGNPFQRSYYLTDEDLVSEGDVRVEVEGGSLSVDLIQVSQTRVQISVAFLPQSAEDDRIVSISGSDATGADFGPYLVHIDSRMVPVSVPHIKLSILTRDFETKEITTGDKLHLTHLGPDADFHITLVSDGAFSGDIPEGEYAVVLEPAAGKSPLGRILITPEHLDDSEHKFIDTGRVVDRSGVEVERSNYSYLVFGADGIPAKLTLNSDFSSIAEVMSDSEFVRRMITQTPTDFVGLFGDPIPDYSLVHMDTKTPIILATFDGEGITFPIYPGPCQGRTVSDEALGYHRAFYDHSIALLNSVQVGGNPYVSIEQQVYDPQNVWQAVRCPNYNILVPEAYPESGFVFHLLDDSLTTNVSRDRYRRFLVHKPGGDRYSDGEHHGFLIESIKTSSTTAYPGIIANRSRSIWALDRETFDSVPNGSVRDGEMSGWLQDKPPVPMDMVQYEFDDRFVRVATAFGPWAQYQLNPVLGERGKNVRLAK